MDTHSLRYRNMAFLLSLGMLPACSEGDDGNNTGFGSNTNVTGATGATSATTAPPGTTGATEDPTGGTTGAPEPGDTTTTGPVDPTDTPDPTNPDPTVVTFGESGIGESGFGESGVGESGFGESGGFGEFGEFGESGFGESGYVPVPPTCYAYAVKYVECYPRYARVLQDIEQYCAQSQAYLEMLDPQCGALFDEWAACLSQSDCQEIASGQACADLDQALDQMCQ